MIVQTVLSLKGIQSESQSPLVSSVQRVFLDCFRIAYFISGHVINNSASCLRGFYNLAVRYPFEFLDKLGNILRKTEVTSVSLPCILQTLLQCSTWAQLGLTEILVSLSLFYSEILICFSFCRD